MFGKNEEEKEAEAKEKADYIIEKSKLTEKELLAEMIFILEKMAKDSEQNTGIIEDIYDIWANTGSLFKRDKTHKII